MRSRLPWLIGLAGLLALARRLRARRQRPLAPAGDARAEELRRKLDESRDLAAERDEFDSAETTIDQATPAPGDLEERRRHIHERGRAAADDMRGR